MDVAGNESTPKAELQTLATYPGRKIVAFVARNPSTPHKVLEELALHQEACVRSATASNPSTPPAVLQVLALDQDVEVRTGVAGNPSTPRSALQVLSLDDTKSWGGMVVRQAVAKNPNAGNKMLEKLALDHDVEVRAAVAANHATPSALLEQLSEDSEMTRNGPVVRLADKQAEVRNAVLEEGGLPEAMYVELVRAGERQLPSKCIAEINDEATLDILSREGRDYVQHRGGTYIHNAQRSILQKPLISEAVLKILAGKAELRWSIAQRTDLPIKLLEGLANDSDEQVVAAALSNPMMPEALMRKVVSCKPCREYWEAVINNPFCPSDLMDEMTEKVDVPRWSAKSWYAKKLAGDSRKDQYKSYLVPALELAKNSQAPLEKLRLLSASGIWLVRWAVASNPTLPDVERKHILDDLWVEVEDALWGSEPPLPAIDVLQEDGIRSALDRLDLLPPAQDKRAIAAAAKSPEMLRRVAAVLSPGIQPSVLKMLLEDPVGSIKSLAAEKLHALEPAV